jgi:hypothetical protein
MWLTRRHLLSLAAIGIAGLRVPSAHAAPLPAGPIALNGFDAVSYFLGPPEAGRAMYETVWQSQTWRFARAGNREAFRLAPESYAPRLDGFDPVAMLAGRLVDTDPLIFARLPGPEGIERLYLLRHEDHRDQLLADPGIAARAEARWPTLRNQIERDFPN